MKSFYSFLTALFFITSATAQLELQTKWWQPNGNVETMVIDSVKNILYLGGRFNYIGPDQAFATQINTGEPNTSSDIPLPNGAVYCSASDGNGGWYIGGDFTKVGDSIRNRIAHISNNGIVTNWNPNPSYSVSSPQIKCIVKQNNIIYVGGEFDNIGGKARLCVAALDASTGTATTWKADLPNVVNVKVIRVSNQTIYVAGSHITNQSSIAALNINTGLPTSWAPQVTGEINDIAIKNDTIIVGGTIYQINNSSCFNLGAINAAGQMIDWHPVVDNIIRAMALKDNLLVIGGDFSSLNVGNLLKNRNHLARIDMITGLVDDWNPSADERVVSMTIDNNNLFLTGEFTKIGAYSRYRIAAIDFYTGIPTNWDFDADATVSTISLSNNSMFIGGYFSSIGGQDRNLIASMDLASGKTTDWNPGATGVSVNAIAFYNDFVYAGGEFSFMGGKQRENLAELNYASDIATNFNCSAPYIGGIGVYALSIANDRLYIGGNFYGIGGNMPANSRMAVINLSTKSLISSWAPNADGPVRCITIDGDIIYVGGAFSNIGGKPRKGIAALDAYTGLATDFDPNNLNTNWYSNINFITTIVNSPTSIFVGGQFYSFGNNLKRNNIASINKASGLVTNWQTTVNSTPGAISLVNDQIYVGGFQSGSNTPLDVYDATIGWQITGYPNIINNRVFAMQFYHNQIFIGGSFYQALNTPRKALAVFNRCSSLYNPIINVSDNYICPYEKTTLSIENADASTTWKWYANSCAGNTLQANGNTLEVSPLVNTTYYVKGSGGCVNQACQSINIYLKTPPFKPYVTNTNTVLTTEEVVNGVYEWMNCSDNTIIQGEDKASYKPLISGDYKVVLSQSGCSNTSDCISIVINTDPTTPTSTDKIHAAYKTKIYPNPTGGIMFVDLGNESASCKLSVITITGKCVLTTDVYNDRYLQLNLENQISGVYIITIEKESGIEFLKIIKQ